MRVSKKIVLLVAVIVMVVAAAFASFASSAKITFSDPNTNIGEEFEMKMKITGDADLSSTSKVTIGYDTAYLEFVSGDNIDGGAGTLIARGPADQTGKEYVYTLKFKALTAGSTSVSISDTEVYDSSENAMEISHAGSGAVTIAGDANASVNANLASLKISPSALSPEFTSENTEYTTVVGEDCEKVSVSAASADSSAQVLISGNSELQMGENTIEIKVTAQDGTTTKTYTIKVTKQEGIIDYGEQDGVLHAEVDGTDYEVTAAFDESIVPEGFSVETYSYHGTEVQSAVNANGIRIMYLIGNDGSGDFFIYDESSDSWAPYATINVVEKSITIIPLPADVTVPEGFAETTIEIGGKKVQGWVWATDTEQKYCIVYGMNQDGETDFYRFDMKEKTIQRYFEDPALEDTPVETVSEEANSAYKELQDAYNIRTYLLLGTAVIAAILLIALILVIILNRGSSAAKERESERRNERGGRGNDSGRNSGRNSERNSGRSDRETSAGRNTRGEDKYAEADEYAEPDRYADLYEHVQAPEHFDEEETYLRGVEDQRAESYGRVDTRLHEEAPKAAPKTEAAQPAAKATAKADDDLFGDDFEIIDL